MRLSITSLNQQGLNKTFSEILLPCTLMAYAAPSLSEKSGQISDFLNEGLHDDLKILDAYHEILVSVLLNDDVQELKQYKAKDLDKLSLTQNIKNAFKRDNKTTISNEPVSTISFDETNQQVIIRVKGQNQARSCPFFNYVYMAKIYSYLMSCEKQGCLSYDVKFIENVLASLSDESYAISTLFKKGWFTQPDSSLADVLSSLFFVPLDEKKLTKLNQKYLSDKNRIKALKPESKFPDDFDSATCLNGVFLQKKFCDKVISQILPYADVSSSLLLSLLQDRRISNESSADIKKKIELVLSRKKENGQILCNWALTSTIISYLREIPPAMTEKIEAEDSTGFSINSLMQLLGASDSKPSQKTSPENEKKVGFDKNSPMFSLANLRLQVSFYIKCAQFLQELVAYVGLDDKIFKFNKAVGKLTSEKDYITKRKVTKTTDNSTAKNFDGIIDKFIKCANDVIVGSEKTFESIPDNRFIAANFMLNNNENLKQYLAQTQKALTTTKSVVFNDKLSNSLVDFFDDLYSGLDSSNRGDLLWTLGILFNPVFYSKCEPFYQKIKSNLKSVFNTEFPWGRKISHLNLFQLSLVLDEPIGDIIQRIKSLNLPSELFTSTNVLNELSYSLDNLGGINTLSKFAEYYNVEALLNRVTSLGSIILYTNNDNLNPILSAYKEQCEVDYENGFLEDSFKDDRFVNKLLESFKHIKEKKNMENFGFSADSSALKSFSAADIYDFCQLGDTVLNDSSEIFKRQLAITERDNEDPTELSDDNDCRNLVKASAEILSKESSKPTIFDKVTGFTVPHKKTGNAIDNDLFDYLELIQSPDITSSEKFQFNDTILSAILQHQSLKNRSNYNDAFKVFVASIYGDDYIDYCKQVLSDSKSIFKNDQSSTDLARDFPSHFENLQSLENDIFRQKIKFLKNSLDKDGLHISDQKHQYYDIITRLIFLSDYAQSSSDSSILSDQNPASETLVPKNKFKDQSPYSEYLKSLRTLIEYVFTPESLLESLDKMNSENANDFENNSLTGSLGHLSQALLSMRQDLMQSSLLSQHIRDFHQQLQIIKDDLSKDILSYNSNELIPYSSIEKIIASIKSLILIIKPLDVRSTEIIDYLNKLHSCITYTSDILKSSVDIHNLSRAYTTDDSNVNQDSENFDMHASSYLKKNDKIRSFLYQSSLGHNLFNNSQYDDETDLDSSDNRQLLSYKNILMLGNFASKIHNLTANVVVDFMFVLIDNISVAFGDQGSLNSLNSSKHQLKQSLKDLVVLQTQNFNSDKSIFGLFTLDDNISSLIGFYHEDSDKSSSLNSDKISVYHRYVDMFFSKTGLKVSSFLRDSPSDLAKNEKVHPSSVYYSKLRDKDFKSIVTCSKNSAPTFSPITSSLINEIMYESSFGLSSQKVGERYSALSYNDVVSFLNFLEKLTHNLDVMKFDHSDFNDVYRSVTNDINTLKELLDYSKRDNIVFLTNNTEITSEDEVTQSSINQNIPVQENATANAESSTSYELKGANQSTSNYETEYGDQTAQISYSSTDPSDSPTYYLFDDYVSGPFSKLLSRDFNYSNHIESSSTNSNYSSTHQTDKVTVKSRLYGMKYNKDDFEKLNELFQNLVVLCRNVLLPSYLVNILTSDDSHLDKIIAEKSSCGLNTLINSGVSADRIDSKRYLFTNTVTNLLMPILKTQVFTQAAIDRIEQQNENSQKSQKKPVDRCVDRPSVTISNLEDIFSTKLFTEDATHDSFSVHSEYSSSFLSTADTAKHDGFDFINNYKCDDYVIYLKRLMDSKKNPVFRDIEQKSKKALAVFLELESKNAEFN